MEFEEFVVEYKKEFAPIPYPPSRSIWNYQQKIIKELESKLEEIRGLLPHPYTAVYDIIGDIKAILGDKPNE